MARIGLIGGTGLDAWGNARRELDGNGPYGPPSDRLSLFRVGGHELLFLPRHGRNHAIAPHAVNYRANIDALKSLNVKAVLAVNAVGGITPEYGPGVLCVPDQLIDYTWGRLHSFSHEDGSPLQHVEFGQPFSAGPRLALLHAAAAIGTDVVQAGCLAVTQGPRLETEAEVTRLRRDGCDLVGMTTMPEAALAREAGLPYACLAVVANWAAGVEDAPITQEGIMATLDEAMVRARVLVESALDQLAAND